MAYELIGYTNGNPPAINADNLNKMDNQIKENESGIININEEMETLLPVDISAGVTRYTGKSIKANGDITSTSYNCTGYVNVFGLENIIYARWYTTSGSEGTTGMAFYDSGKNFITGAFQALGFGADVAHYELTKIAVPENASYARFTYKTDGFVVYDAAQAENSVETRVDELESNVSGLNTQMEKVLSIDIAKNVSRYTGKGIKWSNGDITTSTNNNCTNYVDIGGMLEIIYSKWFSTSSSESTLGMAFYDSSKNFIANSGEPMGYGATTGHYELVRKSVPSGAKYARFTYKDADGFVVYDAAQADESLDYQVKELSDNVENINDVIDETKIANWGNVVDNKVIIWSNGEIDTYNYARYKEFYVAKGMVLEYSYTTSVETFGLAFYDKSGSFISGKQANEIAEITVPERAYICRATISKSNERGIKIKNGINYSGISPLINNANVSAYCSPLSAFDNITCCGDSLTYGVVYTSASTTRRAKHPYPDVLAKITGCNTSSLAVGGYTTSDWYDHFFNQIEAKTNQLAIIYLGTNGGLTDTLDTDAPAADDPSTWADTNTGDYAKIVNQFITVGAKVILIKAGDGTTQSVIKQIADRFHTGLIENKRDVNPAYHYAPDLAYSNTLHYNDLGYAAFAHYVNMQVSNMDSDYLKNIIPV